MNIVLLFSSLSIFILYISSLFFKSENSKNTITFIQYLIISFIIGIRSIPIESDTFSYVKYFQENQSLDSIFTGSFAWKQEYFFFLLGVLLSNISDNTHFYVFCISFLSFAILLLAIYLFNHYQKLPITLFLYLILCTSSTYLLYANVLRQGLALSLVLCSLGFLQKNKLLSIFLLFLAFYTHKSSIFLMIGIPFAFSQKIKIKQIYYLFLLVVPLGFIGNFTQYLSIFNLNLFIQKLEVYEVYSLDVDSNNIISKLISIVLNMTLLYYFSRYQSNKNSFFIQILKLCLIFSSFIFFFAPIAKFSMRLEVYLSTLYPLLYIYALSQFKYRLLLRLLLCFIYMFYSFYVFNHPSINEGILFNF